MHSDGQSQAVANRPRAASQLYLRYQGQFNIP